MRHLQSAARPSRGTCHGGSVGWLAPLTLALAALAATACSQGDPGPKRAPAIAVATLAPIIPPGPGTTGAGSTAAHRAVYVAQVQRHAGPAHDLEVHEGYPRAPAPSQGFTADFMDGKVRLTVARPRGTGQVELAVVGYGCEGLLGAPPAGVAVPDGNRLTIDRGAGLTEWYLNGPLGLEQGFTLAWAPAGCAGDLALEVAIAGDLGPVMAPDGATVRLQDDQGRVALTYSDLYAYDATGRELHSRMRLAGDRLRLEVDARGAVYPVTVDPLVGGTPVKLVASDRLAGDYFGISVSQGYGGWLAVGAYGDDDLGSYSGSVYVFQPSGTTWTQHSKLQASDGLANDYFGFAVAMGGDGTTTWVLTGADGADLPGSQAGAAYIFQRTTGAWTQTKILPVTLAAGDRFGRAVALTSTSPPYAVIGAEGDDSSAGSVYVYYLSGTWQYHGWLKATTRTGGDLFGRSVAVDRNSDYRVAIGAPGYGSNRGAIYTFSHSAFTWNEERRYLASGGVADDSFGQAVALCPYYVLGGAPGSSSGRGAVYVFNLSTGALDATLTASDGAAGDQFGAAVSVWCDASDAVAVVGANLANESGVADSGSAYVFRRVAGSWQQQTKLTRSSRAVSDNFGVSVSLAKETYLWRALVGAHGWDEGGVSATGGAWVFPIALTNGEACSNAAQCNSGYCKDGVCCNTACTGQCQSCASPSAGTCSTVYNGDDPDTCPTIDSICDSYGGCTLKTGEACGTSLDCASRYCRDSVCCSTACTGICEVCNAAASPGTCTPIPDGQDPANECTGTGTCGGVCNGNRACRYPSTSQSCGTCMRCNGAGACSVTPADDAACGTISCTGLNTPCRTYSAITTNRCEGFGDCKDADSSDCTVFSPSTAGTKCGLCQTCDSGGNCNQVPADDSACGTIVCTGLNTTCRTYNNLTSNRCEGANNCKDANSADCTSWNNTASGTQCGFCRQCDGAGTCANVPSGQNPFADCLGAGTCEGKCNGGGACAYPDPAVSCGTCARCNGGGACNVTPPDDAACGIIDCDGLDTDCRNFADLDGTNAPRCKSLGLCKDANSSIDCTVYQNAGDTTSCGTCRRCDGSGGCGYIPGGQDPDNQCAGDDPICGGTCNGTGGCTIPSTAVSCGLCKTCDGAGTCGSMPLDDASCGTIVCDTLTTTCRAYQNLTTNRCKTFGSCKAAPTDCLDYTNQNEGVECQPESCSGNTYYPPDACAANGTCPDTPSQSCGLYLCNGAICHTSCTTDAECVGTAYCLGTTCTGKKSDGSVCAAPNQCQSNHCVDAVCCSASACGQCEACNLTGSLGTCAPVTGADDLDTCTGDTTCDGSGACRLKNGRECGSAPTTWGFDTDGDLEGWVLGDANGAVAGGVLTLTSTGAEPTLTSPDNLDAAAADHRYLKVVMRNTTAATSARVAFTTTTDPTWDALKAKAFAVTPNDPGFTDYLIDMAPVTLWAGTIRQLRVVPIEGPGVVAIDSIALLDAGACASGICTDGLCCNAACGGLCEACDVPGAEGTCSAIPPGEDPAEECGGTGTCNGTCNGAGSCQFPSQTMRCGLCEVCDGAGACADMPADDPACGPIDCQDLDTACRDYDDLTTNRCKGFGQCKQANSPVDCNVYTNADSGTVCRAASCADATFSPVDVCDGGGVCVDSPPVSCGFYACAAGVCGSSCSTNDECATGAYCAAPNCISQGTIGSPCTDDAQCQSKLCVDGACCGVASCGECQSCNLTGTAGMCAPVRNGDDADTCTGVNTCDAAGACKLKNGQGCAPDATACASARCADGVCCNTDCLGVCEACNVAGHVGTCSPVPAGEDPDDECTGNEPPCGGTCNGAGGCQFPSAVVCGTCQTCNGGGYCSSTPSDDSSCGVIDCDLNDVVCRDYQDLTTARCKSFGVCKTPNSPDCTVFTNTPLGTECQAATCTAGTVYPARSCDGKGGCADSGSQSCGLYQCDGAACRTSCETDADCLASAYCAAGSCTAKKTLGSPCQLAAECGSGKCVDSTCCNASSCGTCEACNVGVNAGTCATVTNAEDDSCTGTSICNALGACKLKNGQPCTSGPVACASGQCADGVCCNLGCAGTCVACNLTGAVGTCTNVPAGEDPAAECAGTGLCGGTCNGGGACQFPAGETECEAEKCLGSSHTPARTCDAQGACGAATAAPCPNGTICSADGKTCLTACTAQGHCQPTYYCEPTQSACKLKAGNGKACNNAYECLSGVCADGVCCDRACDGVCERCSAAGQCEAVPDGQDPKEQCAGTGACGGVCNGQRACRFPETDVECQAQSCSDGVVVRPYVCDGTGRCVPQGTASCAGYACIGTQCRTSCTRDDQCAPQWACDVLSGTCSGGLPVGTACQLDGECQSGACAGGRCCAGPCAHQDSTCGGRCDAAGACSFPPATAGCGTCRSCDGKGACLGTPPDDPSCPTIDCSALDGPCGTAAAIATNRCRVFGLCKTVDDCRVTDATAAGTSCGASTCVDEVQTSFRCDGQGACVSEERSCLPYLCEDATVCRTGCQTPADCAAGRDCDVGTGTCRGLIGDACVSDAQCDSGYCTDGVCCEVRCDGTCERCDAWAGCVPVPAETDPDEECVGTGQCGGVCDGARGCRYPGITEACDLCTGCDGAGGCGAALAEDEACGALACSALNDDCGTYGDPAANSCAAAGECGTVAVLSCELVARVPDGTPCTCTGGELSECVAGACACAPVSDAGLDAPPAADGGGPGNDATAAADGATSSDGPGATPPDGGCGCRATATPAGALGGLLTLFALLLSRRRRRDRGAARPRPAAAAHRGRPRSQAAPRRGRAVRRAVRG